MTDIQSNFQLQKYNTFQIKAKTKYFVQVSSEIELLEIINQADYKNLPKMILGGGSNILFSQNYPGLMIQMNIKGTKVLFEDDQYVVIEIGAGENWHQLVEWTVKNNWGGIENLALIPGTVGAAPVQNIAAYGQNFHKVFDSLIAYDLNNGKPHTFNIDQCQFGYRTSIFKQEYKDKFAITKVRLKLNKKHQLDTSYFAIHVKYESIEKELEKISQKPYQIKDVFKAVINIRTRQLPDVENVPSVGSIFVNPITSKNKLKKLQKIIPELQYYPPEQTYYRELDDPEMNSSDMVKLPAGRLLDELEWRGLVVGNCWMYEKHALIATHNGHASGQEMLNFINLVKKDCYQNYGIKLISETCIV